MRSSALDKTVVGGHQMLGATMLSGESPLAESPAPGDVGLKSDPVLAGSKEDLARTIIDMGPIQRALKDQDLARTIAMAAPVAPAAKIDLMRTVALAEPLPREARATIKMERPNLALLNSTQVMEAVAAPAAVPARAPSPIPAAGSPPPAAATQLLAPLAPSHGSASGIRAVAPAAGVAPYVQPHVQPSPALRHCSPKKDLRLVMLAEPNGERASGFRLLRDNIASKGMPRILAVSSAEAKSGTTTCALNLAIAVAEQTSHKVLLIDANFAAPALAEILGIDETSQDAWSAPFIISSLTPSLHVATVARRPDGSSAPVDSATLARMIDSFQRAGYQHIIIDMPAMDGSAEGPRLLRLGGGVLLAVRAAKTTTRALRRAVEQIGPQRALGVALMDAPVS